MQATVFHAANGPETFSKVPARIQLSSTKEGFSEIARIWALFANWSQRIRQEIIERHNRQATALPKNRVGRVIPNAPFWGSAEQTRCIRDNAPYR